jgi:hypothetical protein
MPEVDDANRAPQKCDTILAGGPGSEIPPLGVVHRENDFEGLLQADRAIRADRAGPAATGNAANRRRRRLELGERDPAVNAPPISPRTRQR